MKLDKRIKEMPWPKTNIKNDRISYEVLVERKKQGDHIVHIITFVLNKHYNIWRYERYEDFRLIVSKAESDYVFLKKDGSRKLCTYGLLISSPRYMYVKISEEDEKKLSTLTGKKSDNHQMDTLFQMIDEWRAEKNLRSKKKRGEFLDEDISLCPEDLPEGIEEYIKNEVLPFDNTLIYKKGNVRGTCALCGRNVRARRQRFTQHNYVRCPDCGSKVLCVLENSQAWKSDYVENIAFLQKGLDGESVWIRMFHLKRNYDAKYPDIKKNLVECARYGMRGFKVAMWLKEYKGYTFIGRSDIYTLKNWERDGKIYIYDGYSYKLYSNGIEETLKGTRLEYINIREVLREYRNPLKFIIDFIRFPCLEFLHKNGYKRLLEGKVYNRFCKDTSNICRWERKTPKEFFKFPMALLKIAKPDEWGEYQIKHVNDIWDMKGITTEDIYELAFENSLRIGSVKIASKYKKISSVIAYLKKQETKYGESNICGIYEDYLKECEELELDLKDKNILFPSDLKKRHEATSKAVIEQRKKINEKKFKKVSEALSEMAYEGEGLLIMPAPSASSLTKEGSALHHCVGTYADRMLRGETAIFFIRKKGEPKKSYYTLEYKDKKIVQCRGKNNCSYTQNEEVYAFVDEWLKFIKRSKTKCKKSA